MHQSSVDACARFKPREGGRFLRFIGTFAAALLISCFAWTQSLGQQAQAEASDTLRGTVLNSVTHEPIVRALVFSPDNRFATMTDAQGRFEFVLPGASHNPAEETQTEILLGGEGVSNRPDMLVARKPGFLLGSGGESQISPKTKDVKLILTPEASIVGNVSLPTSEAPEKIGVEIYRRTVQNGRTHWVTRGVANSSASGTFRAIGLTTGTYKIFSHEIPDSDSSALRGQQYAFPPVYYPNVSDFESASEIRLASGESFQADLSLVRQPYYPVQIPVLNVPPAAPLTVIVSMQGRRGPGYVLDYNAQGQRIEGSLPNGTFVVEAFAYEPTSVSGTTTITIHGAKVDGPPLALDPGRSISATVKEEFNSIDPLPSSGIRASGGREHTSYPGIELIPADEFSQKRPAFFHRPVHADDDSLIVDGVQPGRYWVQVNPVRGYASSVTSGTVDLQRVPLVVGQGGMVAPLEVTMRDDTAQVDGAVEGVNSDILGTPATAPDKALSLSSVPATVYCIPVEEGVGQFTQLAASADGKLFPTSLPPGTYRILAFKHPQQELEYRNPDVIRLYAGKGPVVHLVAGQTDHIHLQLISTEE